MRLTAAARRLVASLASVALLLAAVTPALAHLLRPSTTAGAHGIATEVCTSVGPQRLTVASADADAPVPPAASLHDHCPFCGWHAFIGAPPPSAPAIAGLAGLHSVPALFLHAPHRLFAWAGAQPRAPPFLS
jgi:hypothetical protein